MITIQSAPQLFTTLNLAAFKVTSDRPTIIQFRVTLLDAVSGDVMAVQKYATLPMLANGTTFNLAPLLSAFVSPEIKNNLNLIEPISKSIKEYKISILELYLDLNNKIIDGDSLISDSFFIFNSTLSRVDFYDYDYNDYVANGTKLAKFQSNRPLTSSLYYSSNEFLYFIGNAGDKVVYTFYKKGGIIAGTHSIVIPAGDAFRLNISPKVFDLEFGDELLNLYGSEFYDVFDFPFGSDSTINSSNYFTVQIFSSDGLTPYSEKRTYSLKNDDCRKDILEVFFTNNLGGVDSIVFVEPKQSVSSTKTTIQSNPYQFDSDGNYYTAKNGIFNPTEQITASNTVNSFTAVSEPLNDKNSSFSKSLIESDNVYIRLKSGYFFPVSVSPQDYLINKSKHNSNNYRMTLAFSVNDVNFSL